ncbi:MULTISPECIES: uracil phosphoribosyltransferase [unclassified Micromonospora]|uniref:uracil phosphoribosyltransferase n=1 Tax=unclassified Micromonospora TaxID=2617518 RepID=UPI001C6050C4|nr:uracil phosphoribosyltransferase [Micromonospora sp. RL09-050-HVF-A]MBW4701826.1 uracil phosphoribosyltransferase [Micromonospora sp. RL09-050-HVF-A]
MTDTATHPTVAGPAVAGPAVAGPAVTSRLHLLPQTNRLRSLHTVIRDRDASRADFVQTSAQIFRQLLDTALDLLPVVPQQVRTPVGQTYHGLRPAAPVCGVSIARAGESMEGELRAMLPQTRIGKILIQRDKTTKLPHFHYAALPPDIAMSQVLLLDPMLATGGTALAALALLREYGVFEEDVVFVTLLSSPEGISAVHAQHPRVRIVTSAIEERLNADAYMVPGIGDFGDRYFGTDQPR